MKKALYTLLVLGCSVATPLQVFAQSMPLPGGYNNSNYGSMQGAPFYEQCAGGDCCGTTSSTTVDGAGSGCGSPDDPEGNAKIAWNTLKSHGLSDSATAGILGNMKKESQFNTAADNKPLLQSLGLSNLIIDGMGCLGVVQWCGERQVALRDFAKEKDKDWKCIDLQMEFLWYEMTETEQASSDAQGNTLEIPLPDALNGADFARKSTFTGSGPGQAAMMFEAYFERSSQGRGEHLGRDKNANELYKEMTGKEPPSELEQTGSSVAVATNGSSSSGDGCREESISTGIMSAECKALVAKYEELFEAGRIIADAPERMEADLKNCTEDPIECGTGGKGGVNPYILRAVIGAVENTGTEPAKIWNFNTGHNCDGLNHPKGGASDIACNGNSSQGANDAEKKCNEMYKFFYDNYEELKLTELIWTYPPKEFSCGDPKNLCSVPGHADHIHVGINPATL